MKISTIIIDDQQDSIDDLLYLIEKNNLPLNIVTTAKSGADGVVAILKHKPQLVLLDVVMPGMSGFEMIDLLPEIDFQLIITTSMDRYAVQAIRASAIDFLLKPIKLSELKNAIERVNQKRTNTTRKQVSLLKDSISQKESSIKKIALNLSDGIELVLLEDIIYFESEGNYTTVYMVNNKSVVVTKQLGKFEEFIDPNLFYRIHKSFIVNVNHIKKMVKSDGGYVILDNDKSLSIARNRKDAFFDFISKMQ